MGVSAESRVCGTNICPGNNYLKIKIKEHCIVVLGHPSSLIASDTEGQVLVLVCASSFITDKKLSIHLSFIGSIICRGNFLL